MSPVTQPRQIDLPKILDERGNLTFLQHPDHLPFEIARTFFIYDVPGDGIRGGHAYHQQWEVVIALSGSFTLRTRTGDVEKDFYLRRPYTAVILPPHTWRSMREFSTNSLSLHLADRPYDASDYIHELATYRRHYE